MVMAPFSLACLALGGRVVTAEMPAFVGGSTATRYVLKLFVFRVCPCLSLERAAVHTLL